MVKASPRLTKMQELEILRAKQDFENAGAVVKEKEQISSAAARKSFLVDLATCGSSDIENRLSTLNSMMNKGALTRGQKLKAAAFKASGVALNALGVAATVLAFTFPPAAAACLGLAALIGVARMAYTASIGLRIQQGLQANRDTMKATFERRVGQSGPSIDPTEAMDAPIRKNARLTATQATINGIGVAGMVAGAAGFAGSAGLTGFAAGMVSNFAPLFGLPGLIIGAGAIVLNAVGTAWANAAIKNHPAPAAASKSISFNIEK